MQLYRIQGLCNLLWTNRDIQMSMQSGKSYLEYTSERTPSWRVLRSLSGYP